MNFYDRSELTDNEMEYGARLECGACASDKYRLFQHQQSDMATSCCSEKKTDLSQQECTTEISIINTDVDITNQLRLRAQVSW